jgi:signal transduction histidine kinase
LNTVEQVLQASRTREKRRQVSLSEMEITELLEEAADIVRSRYNLEKSVIRIAEPSSPSRVIADRSELQTAFVNLLDNAVKYSAEQPKISIRTKPGSMNQKVDILIRDNGVGIPPADLKRVFKRFYRVNGAGPSNVKGTGLGLAIVKSIVEKYGGRVRAQSRGAGHGSTFIVQLPTI